jgi:glycosyltransferase involved in cell wall biosynthesis
MIKSNIRKMLHVTERLSYKVLTPKQRDMIKNSLTDKQKVYLKKILFSGKWQRSEVNQVKHRLYNLGFTNKGLADLEELCNRKDEPYLNRLARWELALWHANQYDKEHARKCLVLLSKALEEEVDSNRIRQASIMEAECCEILGDIKAAKEALSKTLAVEQHPDLYLAAANLESSMAERLKWVNKALKLYQISEVSLHAETGKPPYDCLYSEGKKGKTDSAETPPPKVSVIIPVYNAEDGVQTSLNSMLSQTWDNLEVVVVDDCSQDKTVEVVEGYVKKDPRVKLIKAAKNGGAYAARNLALNEVTGDFVTIHDADDWSHAEKIEIQVRHLMANPEVIGNTSEQARATNELKFYRRGKPGTYIFSNMSSFLFRREVVTEALGFWDTVRFAADSEFIRRIKKVFGEKSVAALPTGPLSFQRQTTTSLTGNSAFGYHGFKMGARREYEESHDFFHAFSDNLYYDFPQTVRPYAVPEPMWPNKEEKVEGYRVFDVMIGHDFRLHDQSITEVIEDIEILKQRGLKIGLIQMFQYKVSPDKKVHAKIREVLDGHNVQMIVFGEKVTCDKLIIKHPPVLQVWQKYIPEVKANSVHVVVSEAPQKEDRGEEGALLFDFASCEKHLQEYFDQKGNWHPVNPEVRQAAESSLPLANEDWKLEELTIEKNRAGTDEKS